METIILPTCKLQVPERNFVQVQFFYWIDPKIITGIIIFGALFTFLLTFLCNSKCHTGWLILATMGPIFFAFSFFAINEEFAVIFREKRKKKRKKILHIKIVKNAFALTHFFNFWLVKISRQGFSSFLAKFLKWNVLDTLCNFEKSSKKAKIWQKMKKIDFSFFVPHFSAKNEKLKKNENSSFRWDPNLLPNFYTSIKYINNMYS